MGQVNARWRRTTTGYTHWCAGCMEMHAIRTDPEPGKPCWGFDGNIENPTFTPSVKITGKQIQQDAQGRWTGGWVCGPDGAALDHCCHYFLTAGRLIYLADCTHALSGQTVPVPDLPPWAVDSTREEAPMPDADNQTTDSQAAQAVDAIKAPDQVQADSQPGSAAQVTASDAPAAPAVAPDPASPPAPAPAPLDGDSQQDEYDPADFEDEKPPTLEQMRAETPDYRPEAVILDALIKLRAEMDTLKLQLRHSL